MSRRLLKNAQAIDIELDIDDVSLPEIVTADTFFSPPPKPNWLIEGILELGRVGLIVGPGGTGKSTFALQLCAAVAADLPVCDGLYEIGQHGSGAVLYLAGEETKEEIHRRGYTIKTHMCEETRLDDETEALSLPRKRIKNKLSHLHTMSLAGYSTHFTEEGLGQTDFYDAILCKAKKIDNLKLIVVDPLRQFFDGDENSSSATTEIIKALERLAKETRATVLAVHHMSQYAAKNGGEEQYSARGSTALTDNVRYQLNMIVLKKSEAKALRLPEDDYKWYVKVVNSKNNYAPPQYKQLYLKREHGGYLRKFAVNFNTQDTEDLEIAIHKKVTSEYREKKIYGLTEFVKKFGGTNNTFLVSGKKLKAAINNLIKDEKLDLVADSDSSSRGPKKQILTPRATTRKRRKKMA